MLSARAYSFRMKSRLAISLSWIGGYVNVVAWMTCGAAVSHMSGNATHFGQGVIELFSRGHWFGLVFFSSLLVSFLAGAAISGICIEGMRRRGHRSKYILPLALEAILLSAFTIGVDWIDVSQHIGWLTILACCACMAMGLQNAAITRISGSVVRTTHVTGVITDLGLESVQYFLWLKDRITRGGHDRLLRTLFVTRRQPSAQRLLLLASIIGSFFFGATAGTIVYLHVPMLAFAPPVLFLTWLIWVDWHKLIADVHELDLLSDPELKMLGLVKSLLPPNLGIYRLTSGTHADHHDAPNFQAWVDRLPEQCHVAILCLSPMLRFNANSALDLQEAFKRLRDNDRHLLLAGVKPSHYTMLDRHRVAEKIGIVNLCPDLEFAIARGMELIEPKKSNLPAA